MISSEILRILFGFVAVLGLIGLAAMAARRLGLASATGGIARRRRLAIVESLAIDARRRAVIIKCDDKEHLIVLGANGEMVIDRNLEGASDLNENPEAENPFAQLMSAQEKLSADKKDAA
ncbi:MAG: flagellar biosynthetic protein FliO [Pseudomonadota bacterium]